MNWGQAAKNWGQLGKFAGASAWATRTGRGAMIGAGVGAAYGAMSDNTSILGGALGGAALGGLGSRYLGAGGSTLRGRGMRAMAQGRSDYRSASKWAIAKSGFGGRGVATNSTGGAAMNAAAASAPSGATMASNQAVGGGINTGVRDLMDAARAHSSSWGARSPRRAASEAGITGKQFTAKAQRARNSKSRTADVARRSGLGY